MKILINRDFIRILFFCILVSSLTISSFCSLSVLCVLIRAGPADEVGKGAEVDRQKQKALCGEDNGDLVPFVQQLRAAVALPTQIRKNYFASNTSLSQDENK